MSSHYLPLFAIVTWISLSILVWFDAGARHEKRWQWGTLVAVTGIFGFALYVLFVVSPPE